MLIQRRPRRAPSEVPSVKDEESPSTVTTVMATEKMSEPLEGPSSPVKTTTLISSGLTQDTLVQNYFLSSGPPDFQNYPRLKELEQLSFRWGVPPATAINKIVMFCVMGPGHWGTMTLGETIDFYLNNFVLHG